MKKVNPNAALTGATAGAVVAWAWDVLMPDYPMPTPVAIAIAGMLGEVLRYALGFLNRHDPV